jgi:hypothetical protein
MAAPPAPPTERVQEETAPTIVVLVNGDVDELLDAALVAIQAHTQGRPVELLVERSPVEGSGLREQMKQARALAEEHDASGVFWLDLENDQEFLLYLFEPEGLRVLVRRIPTSVEDRPAAIESLGVIVGSSSEAIAAGETIGMTPVEEVAVVEAETEPEATAPTLPEEKPTVTADAPPASTKPGRAWKILRVSLAYAGTSYSDQVRWQHGGSLALSAAVAPRFYVGVDYTLLAPSTVDQPVPMRIFRHPIAAHFGFQQSLVSWLALDAQVSGGVTIDDWDRLDVDEGGVRSVASLGAWLYLHFFVGGGVSIDLGVGADAALSVFDYVATCNPNMMMCPDELVVIDPHILRGRVRGGVSYSF